VTDWSALATERGEDGRRRCAWRYPPEYVAYHDDEWGRPVTDDIRLYEKLCLEGFQSGLSWLTVLRKREGFRTAFAGFDPVKIASYTERDVERLLTDAAIIRNRRKIEATIANARATLEVQARTGSLAELLWSFEPKRRGRAVPVRLSDLPATTPESTALSKELRRRGFRFVGPTTVYATMQALGVVNDHVKGCYARSACEQERRELEVPAGRTLGRETIIGSRH
jgi:DNA-3-methyladenine glycosylase I